MKPWTDLSAILTPGRIALLPKDMRGYPIPYTAATREDGSRDFRVIDEIKSLGCMTHARCGICGDPLGKYKCFVGGPRSIVQRLFTDVWTHRDCAEYALKVCPFLAAPRFAYARSEPQGHEIMIQHDSVSTTRPDVFGLGVTTMARYTYINANERVIEAFPWVDSSWWHQGKEITQDEVVAILKANDQAPGHELQAEKAV